MLTAEPLRMLGMSKDGEDESQQLAVPSLFPAELCRHLHSCLPSRVHF